MQIYSVRGLLFLILLFCRIFYSVSAQEPAIDRSVARGYFQEVRDLCERDGGRLWGVSLCGPVIFVDRKTRMVAANQSDREGNLTREGEIFVGKLPERINIANTAIEWAGVKWTMLLWPLPDDRYKRAELLVHELWHRVQNEIGLPGSMPSNSHLDSLDGRIWLRLEWRALQRALITGGEERRRAVEDALLFRAYRRSLFSNATAEEDALEMHEGIAEYTGVRLGERAEPERYMAGRLAEAEKEEFFLRSFAYSSGPAYGLLLDACGAHWRKNLSPRNDLGDLLQSALSIKLPRDIRQQALLASRNYDGEALTASEIEREEGRRKRIAIYRARFIDGPVIIVPLQKMSMQFNPNKLESLDTAGTVYPEIRIVDLWGILTVTNGALMSPTFSKITLTAPADPAVRPLQGDGWKLDLNPGWIVAKGARKGDYVLKLEEN
jgi:hypothetical protein